MRWNALLAYCSRRRQNNSSLITLEWLHTILIQMRLTVIGASLWIFLSPSVSSAQDWKEWNQANPTYPSTQSQSPPATTPPSSQPETSPDLTPSRAEAEAAFTQGYMDTCLKKAPQSYCNCTLKGLLDVDSMDTLLQEANQYRAESVAPQRWNEAIQACLP